MTTIESIREALSDLDQDAILCDLPDSEFVTGGSIADACRVAGYDESGRVTVNNLRAWNMTVAEFGEHIAPDDTITITERSTGKELTIHSVTGDFEDYFVTREGDGDEPVFDTDDSEIEAALANR